MRLMLWGAITTGYQAITALLQATQGFLYRHNAPNDEQGFAEGEVDNYNETPAGQRQALRENMPYNLAKGVLYGYNTYRLMTQEPDIITFGVSCVAAVQTAKEVYDTATRNERATPNRRR